VSKLICLPMAGKRVIAVGGRERGAIEGRLVGCLSRSIGGGSTCKKERTTGRMLYHRATTGAASIPKRGLSASMASKEGDWQGSTGTVPDSHRCSLAHQRH
jgi:hypothetical protein